MKYYRRNHGATLLELIMFIVILGLLSTGFTLVFYQVLFGANTLTGLTRTRELAQQRMELILGRKRTAGYTSFTDPCNPGPGPSICTPPTGYTVTRTLPASLPPAAGSGETTIQVTATGPNNSSAILNTLVSEY